MKPRAFRLWAVTEGYLPQSKLAVLQVVINDKLLHSIKEKVEN